MGDGAFTSEVFLVEAVGQLTFGNISRVVGYDRSLGVEQPSQNYYKLFRNTLGKYLPQNFAGEVR